MATTGGTAEEGSDNVERALARAGTVVLWLGSTVVVYWGLFIALAAALFQANERFGSSAAWYWSAFLMHQLAAALGSLLFARLFKVPTGLTVFLCFIVLLAFSWLALLFFAIAYDCC
jgi:hypothetical protein